MTKKGFLAGLPAGTIIGVTFSFYNPIIATFLGVGIGAFLGSSKKSGGAIGLLASPLIYLAPTYVPMLPIILNGGENILFILIMLAGALLSLSTTIIILTGVILGIVIGHIMLRIASKTLDEEHIESPKLKEFDENLANDRYKNKL